MSKSIIFKLAIISISTWIGVWILKTNVSIPSDWVLNKALLKQVSAHQNQSFKIKVLDIYPGKWESVCFFSTYKGKKDILRDSKIDITGTRADIWAGGENDMTFLFITSDKNIRAQRVALDDIFDEESGPFEYKANCGNNESQIKIEYINLDTQGYKSTYKLIFYANGVHHE